MMKQENAQAQHPETAQSMSAGIGSCTTSQPTGLVDRGHHCLISPEGPPGLPLGLGRSEASSKSLVTAPAPLSSGISSKKNWLEAKAGPPSHLLLAEKGPLGSVQAGLYRWKN